jgi:hypothetical protein
LLCALVPSGQVHRRHQFPIFDSAHSWNSELGRKSGDMMTDFVDPTRVAIVELQRLHNPYPGTAVLRWRI